MIFDSLEPAVYRVQWACLQMPRMGVINQVEVEGKLYFISSRTVEYHTCVDLPVDIDIIIYMRYIL